MNCGVIYLSNNSWINHLSLEFCSKEIWYVYDTHMNIFIYILYIYLYIQIYIFYIWYILIYMIYKWYIHKEIWLYYSNIIKNDYRYLFSIFLLFACSFCKSYILRWLTILSYQINWPNFFVISSCEHFFYLETR
jgi:hypothetical protein